MAVASREVIRAVHRLLFSDPGRWVTWIGLVGLLGAVCVYWYEIVIELPIDFWGIAGDPPVMALSHAVNIDHWLLGGGPRTVGAPQYYHPGLLYQVIS